MVDAKTAVAGLWADAHPDGAGLLPCVVQDLRTRALLMVAWVSKEALEATLSSGFATYWSRSRRTLWEKGARSGCRQRLVTVRLDCDGDTLLYLVEAILPACHEGTDSCFSRRRVGGAWSREPEPLSSLDGAGRHVLADLEAVIEARAIAGEGVTPPSYTRQLLEAGTEKIAAKIREESSELGAALTSETDERVVAETADVLYHLLVALHARGLRLNRVFEELGRRFSTSGIEEKRSRVADTPDEG